MDGTTAMARSDEPAASLQERLEQRVDPELRAVARDFGRAVLRRVPADQLAGTDPNALAAEMADLLHLVANRPVGEIALRVRNPDTGLDASPEPGTVVEFTGEDRAFLLTTTTEALRDHGHEIVRRMHPILGVEREADGRLRSIVPARGAEHRESVVRLELGTRLAAAERDEVEKLIRTVLTDVVAATRDFQPMRAAVAEVADEIREHVAAGRDGEAGEAAALLDWLLEDNFVLLGCRSYDVVEHDGEPAVRVRPDSGLGMLVDADASQYADPVPLADADRGMRERYAAPGPRVTIVRSHRVSTVHQRVRLLNVWVERVNVAGEHVGQFRLLGLFTRKAEAERTSTVPVLRDKLRRFLELEDIVEDSHDERTFIALFDALPKEELFELSLEELRATLLGLLAAEEAEDVRLLCRTEPLTRTASVIVSVPRDRYDARLRQRIQTLLLERFGGHSVDVDLSLGDRPDAVVRFAVHVPEGDMPVVDEALLEAEVRTLSRTHLDEIRDTLLADDAMAGRRLADEVAPRLPPTYLEHTPPERAVADLREVAALLEGEDELRIVLHEDTRGQPLTRVKLFKRGPGVQLSDVLPILESLGLTVAEELPFRLEPAPEGPEIHVHDYGVHVAGEPVDFEVDGPRLAAAVIAAWEGRLEVDSLNRLVVRAGLDWPSVGLLRAYRRFRRQVGTAYTSDYQNDALVQNPDVARALVELFAAKFDPDRAADAADIHFARAAALQACEAVERLDHDRIVRAFLASIDATVRTNHFLGNDGPLALKFASARVPRTPKPVPHREIFVYAPWFEGIHLRGGPVARGGIRWSDRRDDLRTEILGLMQAQVLKNAVIVPTGAKGGFVLKAPPTDPAGLKDVVRRAYEAFIRALLEVTDDVVDGEVRSPDRVRRHDGDDPYLVVAADRGTATFSDFANAIAQERGFWLGDAFASGGSRGYDHKALGITAKGAWLAVRRHFRELGIDVQTERTTVAGVGDMSGDVFGNGMLQSRAIALVAAFDHRDIFLDPDPDPERAFEERQRLFADPSLTWQDCDREVISEGGGIWSRDRKSIPLSPQVRELLRVEDEELPPPALLQAVLRAPVDLLFAGGIGTFVKAPDETHEEIGDRANDEVRIDATELRARVVGEGANLFLTHRARIQYARRGGRVNADFIDNVAGVDISDHEVNLKIPLRVARARGRLSADERDRLLAQVTDDVVAACLADVDAQVWRLSQEAHESPTRMDAYENLMAELGSLSVLDREVESLPSSEAMAERIGSDAGMTRPELAVLLAAAKSELAANLVASGLPDQAAMSEPFRSYFPAALRETFADLLGEHRLRRELVATVAANELVNRLGVTFAFRLAREFGQQRADVVGAYWIAKEVSGVERCWELVDRLEQSGETTVALDAKQRVDATLETLVREYLRAGDVVDIATTVDRDRPVFARVDEAFASIGAAAATVEETDQAERLVDAGLDPEAAIALLRFPDLQIAPDVAQVARTVERDAGVVASAFLLLRRPLGLDLLTRLLREVEPTERWSRWQLSGLVDDLRDVHRVAAHRALIEHEDLDVPDAIEAFATARRDAVEHAVGLARQAADEEGTHRLEAIAVAVRAARAAVRPLA
ncbi:MAG: NAD-glutamate dehydrogenase domain-containing protein [Nitriliruptorales bacterium]